MRAPRLRDLAFLLLPILASCGGGGSTASPTLVLTASAVSVTAQTPLELTWTSTNTTSCAASGAWSGSQSVSGNASVTPPAAAIDNYTLLCAGRGGSVTQSVTVTVRPVVALSLSANPVAVGASASLNWASPGAAGCTASGAWTGPLAAQGSETVAPTSPGTYSYKLDCTSATGDASQSATLTVTPSLRISSDQATPIVLGQSQSIQWQSAGATACVASGAWSGAPSTSGAQTVTPKMTGINTYSLTCSGNGTSITQSLAVLVNPAVTLSVTPTSVAPGNNAVLTWSSNGATSCTASDAWNGSQPTSGSVTVIPRTLGGGGANFTLGTGPGSYLAYTLTCADSAGDSSLTRVFLRITPNGYSLTSLVADTSAAALTADPNLVNPWGVAFPPGLPAVVANNASSTLTSYDGAGAVQSAVFPAAVHLAPARGGAAFAATGIVANSTQDFRVSAAGNSGVSQLIVVGQGGAIAGWSPAVDATSAVNAYSDTGGAQYTGLALANNFTGNVLFVTDFHNSKIDVFDATFTKQVPTSTSYAFTDPNLPAGYAPYGIYAINNPNVGSGALELFVTYAMPVSPANHDAAAGAGLGLIDVFDGHGNLLRRLVGTGGSLNAPWGMSLGLDPGINYVLYVANTGDGTISEFDPTTGNFLGNMTEPSGISVTIPGLHSVQAGNRYANQATLAIFVASGPQGGTHGGYGRLDPGSPPKFHAPPTITVTSVGLGLYGARYLATVTGATAIGSVDFFDANGNFTWSTITAPYYGWGGASATVSDVDGNIATATAP